MIRDGEGRRRVVLRCTGRGTHGPLKLGEWTIGEAGYAERIATGGNRPMVDALREAQRPEGAVEVTCPKCHSRERGPRQLRLNEQGVRHIRVSRERMTQFVAGLLESFPERHRVIWDVSAKGASLG